MMQALIHTCIVCTHVLCKMEPSSSQVTLPSDLWREGKYCEVLSLAIEDIFLASYF
jgi:hypothetical protein